MISRILEFTITMITGGKGGTVQIWLKKVFFSEGWQKEIERQSIVLKLINSSKSYWIEMRPLCNYRWWSWGWDIIPDQNWIQGWRNGAFWMLPHPRELPTLSRGKLKQSGIRYNKTFSSNEVLILNITVYFIRSCASGQLPGCSCDKLIGKRRRQVQLSLSGHITCVLCFCVCLLCVCVFSWISLAMLHLFYARSSSNSP